MSPLKANPTVVVCEKCCKAREVQYPSRAGRMCRPCAAKLGSNASAKAIDPTVERFMRQVFVNAESGCWEWTGTKQSNGYSTFGVQGKMFRGHRWSYEHYVGPIQGDLEIDHLCSNKACVNPSHLEPVTHAENMRRERKPECVNGHPLTDDNIYVHQDKRHCRSCRRTRNKLAWRAKHGKK